ncbi:MAG: hypothetical protein J3Q66DRAFT_445601 [Benniella sp.]|nr:MAG: hypothetical protein J3Q66DRAFT_445601 [Benniella sp.]
MGAFTPWQLDPAALRRARVQTQYSGSVTVGCMDDTNPKTGTTADTEQSGDDASATTGAVSTPDSVSMDTEGTRDHSPSPPVILIPHPLKLVPIGNTRATTRATGAVANGHHGQDEGNGSNWQDIDQSREVVQ